MTDFQEVNGKVIGWDDSVVGLAKDFVPYRDGNNCVFFAVQEAYQYFYKGGGFAEEEFARFRRGYDDLRDHDIEQHGNNGFGNGFALSLLFMVSYLKEKQIDVYGIYTTRDNIKNVAFAYPEVDKLPLVECPSDFEIDSPTMVLTERSDGGHVFFVRDGDDFLKKRPEHMAEKDIFVGFMKVGVMEK